MDTNATKQTDLIVTLTAKEVDDLRTENMDDLHPELFAAVERLVAARMAPAWALLHAWEAWDGSQGPDDHGHPDSSSGQARKQLRQALTF